MSRALRLLDDVLSLVRERDEAVLRDRVARIESMQLQLADTRRELKAEQDAHAETCRALERVTLERDGAAAERENAVHEKYRLRDDIRAVSEELDSAGIGSPEKSLAARVAMLRECRDRCRNGEAERLYTEALAENERMRADLQRAQAQLATLSPDPKCCTPSAQQHHHDLPAVPGHEWCTDRKGFV